MVGAHGEVLMDYLLFVVIVRFLLLTVLLSCSILDVFVLHYSRSNYHVLPIVILYNCLSKFTITSAAP